MIFFFWWNACFLVWVCFLFSTCRDVMLWWTILLVLMVTLFPFFYRKHYWTWSSHFVSSPILPRIILRWRLHTELRLVQRRTHQCPNLDQLGWTSRTPWCFILMGWECHTQQIQGLCHAAWTCIIGNRTNHPMVRSPRRSWWGL